MSGRSNERRFASTLADRVGTVHHTVVADPAQFPDLLREVVSESVNPNADPIGVSTYALFRAIREAGFTVALTGDGADEIFLGYQRMHTALTTDSSWQQAYLDALAAIPESCRHNLYTNDYRDLLRGRPGVDLPPGDRLASITALEVGERLPAYHLRRVDHLSMAHGVEVRLPFCQRAVQELALSLPQESRLTRSEVKRALRAAARDLVPNAILDRPKQPFTLPISAMMHSGSPMMEHAMDVLNPAALARDGQLAPKAVRRLLRTQIDSPSRWHGTRGMGTGGLPDLARSSGGRLRSEEGRSMMRVHLAKAQGSPSATLVVHADDLPDPASDRAHSCITCARPWRAPDTLT